MSKKLKALRKELQKLGIDGFFVPSSDEFNGEYVPAAAKRLKWITGFTGSAGWAVILKEKAAFFTDGRYTLQAREEIDQKDFELFSIASDQHPTPTMMPTDWIEKNLPHGAKFAIDPWLHSASSVEKIKKSIEKAGGTLIFIDTNPLDAAWDDQPEIPLTPAVPHPLEFAGKSSEEKRKDLSKELRNKKSDALIITLPEEICWLLNVRGNDVPCTPFTLSYAIAHQDGTVDWFIDPRKSSDEIKKWVGEDVRLHDIKEFSEAVTKISKENKTLWLDPRTALAKIDVLISENKGKTHKEASPIQLMKALKNKVEIEGTIKAHIRDGAALTRFLAKLSETPEKFDELSASDILKKLRSEGEHFKGLSFDTISGSGANGAIVHYSSTEKTNQPLTSGPIYLVDSGGQYLDGTTDVTRTVAVTKNITDEMKEHFTRVLKGHIQVAMATFPEGTAGDKLDTKARAALKEVGLDYAHGTGHGVGSYLSVHEGPCGISSKANTAFQPGMVVSNEPGYYKEGAYGIRIESLVTVIDTDKKDKNGKALFKFKTLTMAPIDRKLIEASLLEEDELKWLNDYHAKVRENLLPLLEKKDPKAADFLKIATDIITKPPSSSSKSLKIKNSPP